MSEREPSPPRGKRSLPRVRARLVNLCVKITPEQKQRLREWCESTGRSEGEIIRDVLDRPASWVRAPMTI